MTRRPTVAVGLAVAILTVVTAAQIPQRDPRPAPAVATRIPPAPTGTALVEGQVVADATGAPVGLAAVILIGTRTAVLKVTSADRDGRFSFTNLPADRYTVGASKAPYLGAVAGARRPARPGSPVVVGDGATVQVTVRMPMGASLSGTVYDQNGQPLQGAMVGAMRRVMRNGERVLAGATPVQPTDERGQYRIHGLPPGEYLVSALGAHQPIRVQQLTDADVDAALAGAILPPPPSVGPSARPAPVYYPGTVFATQAAGVLVGAGDDRSGLDVQMQTVEPATVSGIVTMRDGSPLPQNTRVLITTAPGTSALEIGGSVLVGPDGRFSMANQTPGHYVFVARAQNAYGVATVDLQGADTTAAIVMQPPVTLTGRVTATLGTTPPSLAGLRFRFTPLSNVLSGAAAPALSPTTAAGEFRITNVVSTRYVVAGAPFFGASDASVTWGLDTVLVDGVDVTDRAIDIRMDALPKEIVLTLTDAWQDISGRVTNSQGAGVSDYTMMAFPVDEAYWLYESRRIVMAQPDADGQYRLGGPGPALLPAGDYYLAAVTDVSKDEQYDPAFLRSLVPAALRLTLGRAARMIQDVRVQ